MTNEDRRRANDEKIEQILSIVKEQGTLIKEVHQRQNEVTLPALSDIKTTLYAKGGICETVHEHSGEIKEIKNRVDRFPTIVGWILGGISVGAGALLWIYEVIHKLGGGK